MTTIQLFLVVNINTDESNWYEQITSVLKSDCSTEQVEVIKQNDEEKAQIEIAYELSKASLNDIEAIVTNSGAAITELDIHLPTSLTGFADPYHASAISLPLQENLKKIRGVLGGGISSKGEVKFGIAVSMKNKQLILEEVLKMFPRSK